MNTELFRKSMKEGLIELFSETSWIRAAWEGGSAATGFLDRYSDLDLVMVVGNGMVEEAFDLFEGFLREHYGIARTIRVPEPAWHGHSQRFYFIGNAPRLFYIDLLVEKLSSGNRLLGDERHGEAQTWIDRDGIISRGRTEEDDTAGRAESFRKAVTASLPVAATEIRKQIARGMHIDAVTQYQRFVGGRIAGLLNLKYRPAKFDFGARYADREYPEDVRRRLEELLYIDSFRDLEKAFEDAETWAEELARSLDAGTVTE